MSARAEKQGDRVAIWCPACDEPHGPQVEPVGHRSSWTWNGSLELPTFTPSLKVTWPGLSKTRVCHSWITNGEIRFENDSTHALRGKTIPLPLWDEEPKKT